jgi:hypothetical protein
MQGLDHPKKGVSRAVLVGRRCRYRRWRICPPVQLHSRLQTASTQILPSADAPARRRPLRPTRARDFRA